jgi:hypothetical protein
VIAWLLAQQAAPKGPPLQPLPHPELPAVELPPAGMPPGLIALAVLGFVVLLGLVIWLLLRPPAPAAVPPKRPFQKALKALREIQARAATQEPGLTSAQVSAALRTYFHDRYRIPAPFRTSQELFAGDVIPATSQRLHRFAPLAELWDRLAFAPVPASPEEAERLVAQAIAHLEEDRP